jgi:Fe-S-cluster containining protein
VTGDRAQRLAPLPDDRFRFECGPHVPCFNACCAHLNLALTPYDIVRLSRSLGMTTSDFLDEHTTGVEESGRLPRVHLFMRESDGRCPFVGESGCSVYADRPGACRTYPLARASSRGAPGSGPRVACFLLREDHCLGHESSREWTVDQWIADQEIARHIELNDLWMEVVTRQAEVLAGQGADQKVAMFNLASYDLDAFRRFVLKGGLLSRISVPESVVRKLETDDVHLLRFASAWLKLALFGELTPGLTRT